MSEHLFAAATFYDTEAHVRPPCRICGRDRHDSVHVADEWGPVVSDAESDRLEQANQKLCDEY